MIHDNCHDMLVILHTRRRVSRGYADELPREESRFIHLLFRHALFFFGLHSFRHRVDLPPWPSSLNYAYLGGFFVHRRAEMGRFLRRALASSPQYAARSKIPCRPIKQLLAEAASGQADATSMVRQADGGIAHERVAQRATSSPRPPSMGRRDLQRRRLYCHAMPSLNGQ